METKPSEEETILLASGGYDHTIRFWIPHEGRCSRVISHQNSQVNDLKISLDKIYMAVASFQHIRIYNITTDNNNPEINLEGFNRNAACVGFMDDSKHLYSGGEDSVTRIWDLRAQAKNQSQRMQKSTSAVNTVKLHPNQNEFFIGQQSGRVDIWDIRTNNGPKAQLPQHDSSVQSVSFSQQHDLLAVVDNIGFCHLFSPSQQLNPLFSWRAHSRYALKCAFSPDGGYLATTSADHTAKIWKTCDLQLALEQQRQSQQVDDGSAPASGQLQPYKILTCENQRWVWDLVFSADSKFLFTASSDGDVRLWHVDSADMRRQYKGHQKAVTALTFSDC